MNSAKPIFVVELPNSASQHDAHEISKSIKSHPLSEEYHCLVFASNTLSEVKFSVFNAVDADDIKIEEVIQMVENMAKS